MAEVKFVLPVPTTVMGPGIRPRAWDQVVR